MHPRTKQSGGRPPDTDDELIGRAREGDADAYGELVRRHQRAAIRVAAVVAGSPEGADDVAQEAFMKAHSALNRFRTGSAFRPWLLRIVANTARNSARSDRRRRALTLRAAAVAPIPTDAPADLVTVRDDRDTLLAAMGRLSIDDRTILAYRWFEDLPQGEIAVALGCRPGTVKSRLSRAMDRLRAEMGAEAP